MLLVPRTLQIKMTIYSVKPKSALWLSHSLYNILRVSDEGTYHINYIFNSNKHTEVFRRTHGVANHFNRIHQYFYCTATRCACLHVNSSR